MHEFLMANKDSEILPAEITHDPPCDFNVSTVEPSSLADALSVYLESCEPFHVTDPGPANNLDEATISRTDAIVDPFNSIALTESSEFRDNDGKDVNENKVKEIKRSSSRRSTRKSSSNQRTDSKLTARKSRKKYGKRLLLDLLAAEVGKGQRSDLVRRARLSPWGLGKKIDEIFEENTEKYVDPNEHSESIKGNIGLTGAKSNTVSAHQNIQISLGESRVSNKGLLLKFKLGTKAIQTCQFNTIPDMEKDVESYREVKREASTLQSDIKNSFENEKQILSASNENLDKELVSSKSVENGCLDPGTSPDSEVINVILETQNSGSNTTEGLLHDTQISSKDSISHQSTGDFGVGSGIPSPEIVNDVLSCDKFVNGDNKQIEGSWCSGASNGQNSMEPKADDHSVPGIGSVEFSLAEKLKSNGSYLEKNSRSEGIIKSMSGVPGLVNKKKTNSGLKGSQSRSSAKGKIKDKTGKGPDFDTETHQVTGSLGVNDAAAGALCNSNMVLSEGESRQGSPPSAWVCCDDCHKWRRISAVLADAIESTECRWICKDNMDKVFADCSIPQEKSNADINEELELSEASCEEDASNTRLNSSQLGQKQLIDTPQPSWKLIKTNMFLHRNRKNQPIDEVMVCHCRPPLDGRMGCRDECLNRMLNIECVKGTCPCGELCSNQKFQKRKYSKLKCVPSGKKGYGLQLQEDIPKGRFLIEYVGEVLDMPAYEARQREYASKGHKHFYFMTLNGSEVIDACAKGNLGRFINHSCEPNCRTEKWMVNGEVCIGLFAVRDIKKGEELTFDYNYVRVFGAAAKKCVCGSSMCRGIIGGDPLTDETIVLGDSDEEYAEPVMFYGNSSNKLDTVVSVIETPESISKNNVENDQIPDSLLVTDEKNNDPAIPVESTEREVSFESKTEETEELLSSCVVPLDKKGKNKANVQNENITSVNLLPEDGDSKKKLKPKSHTSEKNRMVSKSQPHSKLDSPSSTVKRGKSKSKKPETDNKPLVVPQKPKKIVVDNLTGRFEAVEEALNTLLTKGGISKRRDASKGYLTLLCLTANGGNGEGIQSNRDLSMILDALLRTRSRTVLLDIINKNGLQMLHILMKRYRKVFNKTPILRKLLKVLEFLAETKILTLEYILKPSLPGVESFKESILSLTEHADREVHQIARNFRDRYIPWSARRVNRAERDTERDEFQQNSDFRSFQLQQSREIRPGEVADNSIIKQSLGGNTNTPPVDATTLEGSSASCPNSSTDGTRIRKRKSRWDQPASPSKKEFRSKLGGEIMNNVEGDGDGDAPPGFSSPNRTSNPSSASHHCKTVMGQPQERYISGLPTAFGIPCSLVKRIGTPAEGAAAESWIVAPAMTYHPFPPLPVYPHGEKPPVKEQSWGKCTDRTRAPFNHLDFPRDRNSNTLGKRYFKQQKWNNSSRPGFPWNPNKYGPAGFMGPNKNQPNTGVEYGGNEANGTYNTANYYQHQPHHQ